MRTRNRIRSVVAMAAAVLMLLPSVALADDVQGDGLEAIRNGGSLDLGTVCAGQNATGTVYLAIRRTGGANNSYADSSTVTVASQSATTGLVAGAPSGSIATPNNWQSSDNNTLSSSVTATVTLNTNIVGPFSGTVTYRSSGPRASDGATLTTTDDIAVSSTVASCSQNTTTTASNSSATYGDSSVALSANVSGSPSVGTVTFTVKDGTATVGTVTSGTVASGAATANFSLSGLNVKAYTLEAAYSGGAGFNASTSAPATLTVNKADTITTVNCPSSPLTYTGAALAPCSASATGAGGLNESLTVAYGSNVNVGTVTASASYAGGANHHPSSDSKTFSIAKATPSISIDWSNSNYDGNPNAATASVTGVGGANLGSADLTYYSGTTSSGTPLVGAPTNADTYTVKADYAGTANYNSASNTKTITISKADTVTTVTCDAGPFTYNGAVHAPCSARVTGPGGLDQSASVSYHNNVDAGTATASASYAGSSNYEASTGSKTFMIDKAATTTTVTCSTGPFVYTGSAFTPCTAKVTGPVGLDEVLTVAYSGNTNVGTATASASYAGSTNYEGSSASKAFTISAWRAVGFHSPIGGSNTIVQAPGNPVPAANGSTVWNTAKGGSTVPLKFNVYNGEDGTERTDLWTVSKFTATTLSCPSGGSTDAIETAELLPADIGTGLKYDGTQFHQNWKTAKVTKDTCYRVGVTLQDGTALYTFVRLLK